MLLEKWCQKICSTHGCHKPSICETAASAKRSKASAIKGGLPAPVTSNVFKFTFSPILTPYSSDSLEGPGEEGQGPRTGRAQGVHDLTT